MNQKQAKKRRYNAKLQYIAQFEIWIKSEPPFWNLIAWRRWRKSRPQIFNFEEIYHETL